MLSGSLTVNLFCPSRAGAHFQSCHLLENSQLASSQENKDLTSPKEVECYCPKETINRMRALCDLAKALVSEVRSIAKK